LKPKNPLPLKINLGYQDISIVPYEFINNEQGAYSSDSSEIRIQKDMSPVETLNTMLHECLHACVYVYGLKEEFKDDEHEEKVINALGNAMTELFRRNPKMIGWIGEQI